MGGSNYFPRGRGSKREIDASICQKNKSELSCSGPNLTTLACAIRQVFNEQASNAVFLIIHLFIFLHSNSAISGPGKKGLLLGIRKPAIKTYRISYHEF